MQQIKYSHYPFTSTFVGADQSDDERSRLLRWMSTRELTQLRFRWIMNEICWCVRKAAISPSYRDSMPSNDLVIANNPLCTRQPTLWWRRENISLLMIIKSPWNFRAANALWVERLWIRCIHYFHFPMGSGVSGVSERACGGANGPLLKASIS